MLPFFSRLYSFAALQEVLPTFPVLTDYQRPVRWEDKSVPEIKPVFM